MGLRSLTPSCNLDYILLLGPLMHSHLQQKSTDLKGVPGDLLAYRSIDQWTFFSTGHSSGFSKAAAAASAAPRSSELSYSTIQYVLWCCGNESFKCVAWVSVALDAWAWALNVELASLRMVEASPTQAMGQASASPTELLRAGHGFILCCLKAQMVDVDNVDSEFRCFASFSHHWCFPSKLQALRFRDVRVLEAKQTAKACGCSAQANFGLADPDPAYHAHFQIMARRSSSDARLMLCQGFEGPMKLQRLPRAGAKEEHNFCVPCAW